MNLHPIAREMVQLKLSLGEAQFALGRELIVEALEMFDGDILRAAQRLQLTPAALRDYLWVHRLGEVPGQIEAARKKQPRLAFGRNEDEEREREAS